MSNTAGRNCKNGSDFQCPAKVPLPLSEISVAKILKQQGYHTAAFGKWHLGDLKDLQLPRSHPIWNCSNPGQHGFDVWKVTERAVPTANPNCACFNSSYDRHCQIGHYRHRDPPPCTNYHSGNGDVLIPHSEPIIGDDSHFIAEEFGNFLSNTVMNSSNQPFFAYIAFHTVHKRFIAAPNYFDQYSNYSTRRVDRDYYGAITGLDDAIGKIKRLLKHYNLSENTMIWFTSDNGPERNSPGRTGGLKGEKGELYEGGIRVPGIIEWPAVIKRNWVSNFSVVTSDFLPTVCDIVGVNLPPNLTFDGISMLPFLQRQDPTENYRNESIMWLFNSKGDYSRRYTAAITANEHKLLVTYNKGKMVASSLYDVVENRGETFDMSELLPNKVKDLKEQLETWKQSLIRSAREVGCLTPPM